MPFAAMEIHRVVFPVFSAAQRCPVITTEPDCTGTCQASDCPPENRHVCFLAEARTISRCDSQNIAGAPINRWHGTTLTIR